MREHPTVKGMFVTKDLTIYYSDMFSFPVRWC